MRGDPGNDFLELAAHAWRRGDSRINCWSFGYPHQLRVNNINYDGSHL